MSLTRVPGWAALVATGVAAAAMAARGAWPSLAEVVALGTSTACVAGALRLPSRRGRIICAGLWIGLLGALAPRAPLAHWGAEFRTFYDGADLLFGRGASPYAAPGTSAFPFPTFLLVRALSLGGALSVERATWVFVALQIALLATALGLLRRVDRAEAGPGASDRARELLQAGLLLHPAIVAVVVVGQSVVVAGVAAACAVWCWRCGKGRLTIHAAALCLNLAWMVKPQLAVAGAFFLLHWLLERRPGGGPPTRASAIGRLLVPWAVLLLAVSLPIAYPAYLLAYLEFPRVAAAWHTQVAEAYPYNYALPAVVAKALQRAMAVPVGRSLPVLTAGLAAAVALWNFLSLLSARRDSLSAFLPWLLASLLWTSLVWEYYLGLVLAALVLLPSVSGAVRRPIASTLRFGAALGLTLVVSSFALTLGLLLLYIESHAVLAHERRGPAPAGA
ncbi:MAG: hypothetical protein HY727_06730 [Candidatus Rokubacteria bacterium]|nr:hypothetical protein [Candidatus Rokubacteria bacterium]